MRSYFPIEDVRHGTAKKLPDHDGYSSDPYSHTKGLCPPCSALRYAETARLLETAPGIKYKAALSVPYGAGLRVSGVAHLKVDDVDSTRMLIRLEQGTSSIASEAF
jgi:Site-specific recombinase XerD